MIHTIASFANSSGGWLFIGISNDGTVNEIEKEKNDFSQQISNFLSAHVTPMPLFNCRFIKSSADLRTGVLVIHVFEGSNPPYISKGRIYVRNGSSKIPVNASRADVDNLFAKSSNYKNRLKEIIENQIGWLTGKAPFAIIGLCNLSGANERLSFTEIEDLKKVIIESGYFSSCIRTAESVIFLNSDIIKPNSCTNYIELFFDKSIRMIYYLPCISKGDQDAVNHYLKNNFNNMDISNFVMVDLCTIIMQINNMSHGIALLLEEMKKDLRSYLVQAEFRNMQHTFAYFNTMDEFINYVKDNGLNYSLKDNQRTFVDAPIDTCLKDRESYIRAITYKYFAHALGYSPQEFLNLYRDLSEKHKELFQTRSISYSYDYERK